MYHVRWMLNDLQMVSRWFTDGEEALAFAKRYKIAVVFDPRGHQIYLSIRHGIGA